MTKDTFVGLEFYSASKCLLVVDPPAVFHHLILFVPMQLAFVPSEHLNHRHP